MKRTRKTSSRVKAAMLAAGCTIAAAGVADAALIAVNFQGTAYGTHGGDVTAEAYGVAAVDWNDQEAGAGGNTTIDGVSISWTCNNGWGMNTTPTAGDEEVQWGYVDDSADNASLTLTGLSAWLATDAGATGYTVTLIQGTDGGTGFTDTPVFDSDGGTLLGTFVNSLNLPNGPVGGAADNILTLTSDTLYLDPDIRVDQVRGTIAGVIIETVPEPATLGMVAIFGGGLFLMRRRARN